MTFKEFKQWVDLHSDFIKQEDREKLDNLLKMAHTTGFHEAKKKIIELLNTKYGNSHKSSRSEHSGDRSSVRSRFQKGIHDWLER